MINQAQYYFRQSWDKKAFDGKACQTPKRRIPVTNEYKYPIMVKGIEQANKRTLVRSGALRQAVGRSIKAATWDNIKLIVALVYPSVHNEGKERNTETSVYGSDQGANRHAGKEDY